MSDLFWNAAIGAAERGWMPDSLIRFGIRRLCEQRLQDEAERAVSAQAFAAGTRARPVAPLPEAANEQHYEAPPDLFRLALGPRLKYSCCWWGEGAETLAEAEEAALRITCERAELADGQDVLELGCGWGSLTLWMAEQYPESRIAAVSNSAPQREFILARAAERGLKNIRVLTADMNGFAAEGTYDRIVSIEMFEHMRNYGELLGRVSRWMRDDAKLFVHVFCHRRYSYEFETEGATNWLGRQFFTGGIMPSADLLPQYGAAVSEARQWSWNGRHYERTANAWLENMDRNRDAILQVLADGYGSAQARVWFERWRMFFLACAELWGYAEGEEWQVAHYLFEKADGPDPVIRTDLAKALVR